MSLLTTAKSALEFLEMLGEGALVEKLRAAIAEAEKQEPVAEVVQMYGGSGGMVRMLPNTKTPPVGTKLYVGPAALTVPQGWQPIETAPKDGTPVLVYPPTWAKAIASIAKWNKDEYAKKPRPYWRRVDDYGKVTISRDNPPTHWMPLPAAPKPENSHE